MSSVFRPHHNKFVAGMHASLGITSFGFDPDKISGCETEEGRKKWANNYLNHPMLQLIAAGAMLRKLAQQPNRFPNSWHHINRKQMSIILTEYNRGATGSPNSKAKPSKYGRRFLIDFESMRRALYGG